jgi:hypothetical protein
MAILEDSGWKYYAEIVKSYALNANGMTLNFDPNETTLELDSTPLRSNITGLVVASNQISLPTGLEYLIQAQTMAISNTGQIVAVSFFRDVTGGGLGVLLGGTDGSMEHNRDVRARTQFFNSSGSAMLLEYRAIFACTTGDLRLSRNYTAPAFSSTANIDHRTRVIIRAK